MTTRGGADAGGLGHKGRQGAVGGGVVASAAPAKPDRNRMRSQTRGAWGPAVGTAAPRVAQNAQNHAYSLDDVARLLAAHARREEERVPGAVTDRRARAEHCPQCGAPARTRTWQVAGGEGHGRYVCTRCGHRWECSWQLPAEDVGERNDEPADD
jgi:DNA-directed RNA polymerase subunit M/transcription elongation factor TFIIS